MSFTGMHGLPSKFCRLSVNVTRSARIRVSLTLLKWALSLTYSVWACAGPQKQSRCSSWEKITDRDSFEWGWVTGGQAAMLPSCAPPAFKYGLREHASLHQTLPENHQTSETSVWHYLRPQSSETAESYFNISVVTYWFWIKWEM